MNKFSLCAGTLALPTPSAATKIDVEVAIIQRFNSYLTQHGLVTNDEIVADGELHRFHVEDDTSGSKNGWYILHVGDVVVGRFGCWKRDINERWYANAPESLSQAERDQLKQALSDLHMKREHERQRIVADCAIKAGHIWLLAQPVSSHPYLTAKRVLSHELRTAHGCLVLPLRNIDQQLVGLQFISNDGSKRFLTGTPKRGNFLLIDNKAKSRDTLLVCEGYATGASLYASTGYPVAVAFDAGNLGAVAVELRTKYPDCTLVICADNDHLSETNTGLDKGREAAAAVRGRMAFPPFDASENGTDFNDLSCSRGIDAVRNIIEQSLVAADVMPDIAAPAFERQDIAGTTISVDAEHIKYLKYIEKKKRWLPIASAVRVIAETRDYASRDWGRLLEWRDRDGITHRWAMPMEMLQGDGVEIRKMLASHGVSIVCSSEARVLLTNYLSDWRTDAKARCVSRLGWEGGVYVTPDRCVGKSDEIIVYQSNQSIEPGTSRAGTLDEWNAQIGKMAVGNSRLVFAISIALAAPMAALVDEDSGGFNLRGASSCGKSTALKVAASVWGRPDRYCRNWRATANGLEGLATMHNDALLILDELSQIQAGEAGDAAYMLANGQGKARAGRAGETRQSARWRLLFLSAGEISLATLMESAGKQANAGQEIRLADIPADAGAGLGLFESIHSASTSAAFAEALAESSVKAHGELGVAWLELLVERRSELTVSLRPMLQSLVSAMVPAGSSGQISRVARRFALVGIAGEIAAGAGLVDWPDGEASASAINCFRAWLESFGDDGDREDRAIIDRLKQFILAHGSSRFECFESAPRMNGPDIERVNDRAGFVSVDVNSRTYWLLPGTFRTEVFVGLDSKRAEKLLIREGYIRPGGDGRPTVNKRFGTNGNIRAYALTQRVFE